MTNETEAVRAVALKFKSGNNVPVSTAVVTASEWETVAAEIDRLTGEVERLKNLCSALESQSEENFRKWEIADGLNGVLTEGLVLNRKAHDDLFTHCLSNGVFNAWGHQLNCTSLNKAREATDRLTQPEADHE